MQLELSKRLAAEAALALLPPEGVLGLGTGSTVRHFIIAVGELVRAGRKYVGVPTSEQSRALAASVGIPLLADDEPWGAAICVDGADEVSPSLDLIKGGGGAHTREKIVNFSSRMNVIVVDFGKLSDRLGQRCRVPLEVLPFAHLETAQLISAHGKVTLRLRDGVPFRTDSGNYVYDLDAGAIDVPATLDVALKTIPGVVETGLFCGRADIVLVGRSDRVEKLVRS
jgi:ribose 5-phosphate isomerase A